MKEGLREQEGGKYRTVLRQPSERTAILPEISQQSTLYAKDLTAPFKC